jgi:uncharacterized protein (DUF58 family)
MKTKYLNPNIVNQLNNLYIKAKLIVEGTMYGLHKSPFHGFSAEFSEHRAYSQGDQIKNIDWKLWSKTDKYYIKRFEEETNLSCHIFLDASKSMDFTSSNVTKFQYSQMIAAALSYLIIKQKDSLGLYTFNTEIKLSIPPKNNKNHLNTILTIMENMKTSGSTNISKVLNFNAEKIKKSGLIILITDLLDDTDKILEGLKHFQYYKHEILVFHVLDKQEVELEYKEKIIFEDLENKEKVNIEPWQIKDSYNKEYMNKINYFKSECLKNRIEYNLVYTDQDLDQAIHQFLNKRKMIN